MTRFASIVVLVIAAHASAASADGSGSVVVNLTPAGQALAASIGTSPTDLANQIQSNIANAYQTNNVNGFLRSFTDATAFSQSGLGVDYATLSNDVMLGIGGNLSVSSPDVLSNSDHPTGGAAANLGLMLGVNLAGAGLPRWTIFGNGFYESESTSQLSGHLTSIGGHLQYRLVQPEQDSGTAIAVRWIGIDITSGVEYTRWSLGANDSLTNTFDVSGTTMTDSLTLASTGTFNLTSNSLTIPVEISTGLRIFELVSIYGGGGWSFTAGSTSVTGNLLGNLTDSTGKNYGTVTINESGSNTGSPAVFHAFAGVQVNLWRLKIFAQGNVSQTPAASISAGVRLLL